MTVHRDHIMILKRIWCQYCCVIILVSKFSSIASNAIQSHTIKRVSSSLQTQKEIPLQWKHYISQDHLGISQAFIYSFTSVTWMWFIKAKFVSNLNHCCWIMAAYCI